MAASWRFIKYQISIVLGPVILISCFQSDYTRLVKTELSKNVRVDSVMLGVSLGDSKDEYYGTCFELNKKKLLSAGPSGISVQYLYADSLADKAVDIAIIFIPYFDSSDKIMAVDLEFGYVGWAPWNEKYQSDKLKEKVLGLLMKWYQGNEFIQVKVEGNTVPLKLDGNRRIIVSVKNEKSVIVKIQDILHPQYRHSNTLNNHKKN